MNRQVPRLCRRHLSQIDDRPDRLSDLRQFIHGFCVPIHSFVPRIFLHGPSCLTSTTQLFVYPSLQCRHNFRVGRCDLAEGPLLDLTFDSLVTDARCVHPKHT